MSIFMMCNESDVGAVACKEYPKVWLRESHKGCVVMLGEYNGYDDSDFYAEVWNEEAGKTERITYASTRGWSYPCYASVDAPPEIIAKAHAFRVKMAEALVAAREAVTFRVGNTVKVSLKAGKNKVRNGEIGQVFWIGQNRFSRYPDLRAGVKFSDGEKVFLSVNNLKKVVEAVETV